MLRSLRSKLFHVATLPMRHPTTTSSLFSLPPLQSLKPYSSAAAVVDPSLTLHFLQNSCGLLPDAATAAAKKVRLKSTENAHAVLDLLRGYGFSVPQITGLVSRRPVLLTANPAHTLKPKMDFFLHEVGLSSSELPELLTLRPWLLLWSVERRLAPNLAILRSAVPDEAILSRLLRRYSDLLCFDLRSMLFPRIEALRSYGVTDHVISTLFKSHALAFIKPQPRFDENLDRAMRMGVRPSSTVFAHALWVLYTLPQPRWDLRMANFKRLGWSEEQVISAFAKHPFCMSASSDKVRRNMEFFAEKLRWTPEYVSANPTVLSHSFEKWILPRCLILSVLASEGLVKGEVVARQLLMPNKSFLQRYVIKYHEELRQISNSTKMEFQGFEVNYSDSIKLLQTVQSVPDLDQRAQEHDKLGTQVKKL